MSHTEIYPSAGNALATFVGRASGERLNLNAGEFEPDPRLMEVVERALRATGRAALRRVVVEVCREVIILQGRVPSYYEKQLAQATVRFVADNRQVVNDIEVVCCR